MKVLIIHNAPADPVRWRDEHLSDTSVSEAADAVASALTALGHTTFQAGIDKNPTTLLNAVQESGPDVVFNLCETIAGNSRLEAAVPYLLRWLDMPFTGNSPETLSIFIDKILSKRLIRDLGIHTPLFDAIYETSNLASWSIWPAIMKPAAEDASLGIDSGSVVKTPAAAMARFQLLAERFGTPVLIEEFIEGREINAAVLQTVKGLRIGVNEIDFSRMSVDQPHILTYESKWKEDSPDYLQTPVKAPANLPEPLNTQIRGVAGALFQQLGFQGYARVDFRIDERGQPWVLEVNPNPDLSPDAGLAKAFPEMGLDYQSAMEVILQTPLRRREAPRDHHN